MTKKTDFKKSVAKVVGTQTETECLHKWTYRTVIIQGRRAFDKKCKKCGQFVFIIPWYKKLHCLFAVAIERVYLLFRKDVV